MRVEPTCVVFGASRIHVQRMFVLVVINQMVGPACGFFGDVHTPKHDVEGVAGRREAGGHLILRDVFRTDYKCRAVGNEPVQVCLITRNIVRARP